MEKDVKVIKVNELLALCSILDEFDELKNNINNLFNKLNLNKKIDLYSCLYAKKIDKMIEAFYNENKVVLEKINTYVDFRNFLNDHFNYNGKLIDSNLLFYYDYLIKNKDHLNEIFLLLKKLDSLSISEIAFDENLDCTDEEYNFDTYYTYSSFNKYYMTYVDNMKAIPLYDGRFIKYKTTNTDYKIDFNSLYSGTLYASLITVKSLLFDIKTLPSTNKRGAIILHMKNLVKKQKDEYNALRNAVSLSVLTDDLSDAVDKALKQILNLESVKNKEELIALLKNIKINLEQMHQLNKEYQKDVIDFNLVSSNDVIENEKKKILNRRLWQGIDAD